MSFFSDNFTKFDWGILLAAVGLIGTVTWFAVDLTVEAKVASIRADVAILKDEIEDAKGELLASFNQLDNDLTYAFENMHDGVVTKVEDGMRERSDELSRALLAKFDIDHPLVVSVANVPTNDVKANALIMNYMDAHGSATKISTFADKIVFETRIDDIHGDAAKDLQIVLQKLWSDYPDVETSLGWK